MRINASKCKVMRITKKKSPFTYDYHIDGAKLDSVSLHRDLGLLTYDVLSWNYHIANITAKASSTRSFSPYQKNLSGCDWR